MKSLILLTVLFSSIVCASSINIENARVRLLPPSSKTTGVFMKLSNSSSKDVLLIKAKSDISNITELHNHINENGFMKMREVPSIKIPANGHVMLKPGSFHIMLIDLKKPLTLGQNVKISLTFSNSEKIEITPKVRKIKVHMKNMKH